MRVALKDRVFDVDTNAAIVSPLTATAIARIETSFVAWADSAASEPFRFRRPPGARRWRRVARSEAASRARASIHRLPGSVDLTGLERAVRAHRYENFGAELIVTDDAVALSMSHRFSDGLAAGRLVRTVFGDEPVEPTRARRWPLLLALRETRQLSVRGILAGRAYHREMDWVEPLAAHAEPGRVASDETVTIAQVSVSADELSALVRAERAALPEGERLAPGEVLAALTVRTLRRCLVDDRDLPVVMTVGLRRFLPAGVDARGNFAAVTTVGTLRSSTWTSREVRDQALPRARDARAVPAAVVDVIARARHRLRPSRGRHDEQGRPLAVVLNLLHGGLGISADDVPPGETLRPALVMVPRGGVSGPHCTVVAGRGIHVISVLDDSGILELTRLADAFAAECRILLTTPDVA